MSKQVALSGENALLRFRKVCNAIVVVLFMAMLFMPLLLLFTTGEDKVVMEGEKQYTRPAFTVSEFATSEFQNAFESWFSTKYPMRSSFVSSYRQLQYDTSNIGFDISSVFLVSATTDEEALKAEGTEQAAADGEAVGAETGYSVENPMYADINKRLYERKAVESASYKGTEQVVVGKSGYLYENGYINEYYGYSQKYRDCSDEYLQERVEKLAYIQERLSKMGKAFALIITPSKAAEYERFIPEWYKAQNVPPEDYERPVERLIPLLDEAGITYLRCSDYYKEIGLDETFPLTGIHWNKIAAFEASRKMIDIYEELRGVTTRNITSRKIIQRSTISGFGSNDADIFGIAYSGVDSKDAIRDDLYYWPEIEIEDYEVEDTFSLFLQGGSFSWDLKYYYEKYGLINKLSQFDYNNWQGGSDTDPFRIGDEGWKQALMGVDYVILECNEQYVCMMGTNPPRWGAADKKPLETAEKDVYESLYNYLKSTEKN